MGLLEKYLPAKNQPVTKNAQGKVPEEVYDEAKRNMKAEGLTWDELITSLLQLYNAETKARKK